MKIGACVYLMEDVNSGLLKIGYTTQMPEKRKAQIQKSGGNPFKKELELTVRSFIFCESEEIAKFIEAKLLQDGCDNLVAGNEWFSELTPFQEEAFLTELSNPLYDWKQVANFMEYYIQDIAFGNDVNLANARAALVYSRKVTESIVSAVDRHDWESYHMISKNFRPVVNSLTTRLRESN